MTGLGLNIAWYLFLGGAGGGLCVVASVLALLAPSELVAANKSALNGRSHHLVLHVTPVYRMLFGPLYACALVLLALGCLFLIADLGVSDRAVLLFTLPHPTFITFGSIVLALCMAVCLALAAVWGLALDYWRYRIVYALEIAAAVIGFAVTLYTGLLLSSVQAVPLWSSAWLPALFVVSALSCGCAFAALVAGASGASDTFSSTIRRISTTDVTLIVLEAAVVAVFLAGAIDNPYEVAGEGARALLEGELSGIFIWCFIGCGLVVPFVFELAELITRRRRVPIELAAAICVLVGGFALRYCIVVAGMHPEVWI